jgi:hypothetical protein
MIVKRNRIRDLNNLEIPDELKIENQDRRPKNAVFDRVDLVVDFQPGKDSIGAIVRCFNDAIHNHDIVVKEIEQQMIIIDELKRNYRKKVRLFRNLDNTWNVLDMDPVEFNEYQELIPRMKNIEERLLKIDDMEFKAKLEVQYERFKILEPKCSRQKIIYELYQAARREKDAVTKEYIAAEKFLTDLREREKVLASLVSDDHINADEKEITLSELFPNIHVGNILVRINQYNVENLPFEEVMKNIAKSKSPHKIEVKRYDYRFNAFENVWHHVAELRKTGVFIENPILNKVHFISAAAKGDLHAVKALIDEGEDPNCTDLTGNTAIVAASVNKHFEMVELLQKKGANVNCRDKNNMTPLLYVINRGSLDLVRLLLAYGAEKTAVDKNAHGCFYYALMSQNLQLVKMFFNPLLKNVKEKLWGFTPLHLAANIGNLPLVNYLLEQKCSIYQMDFKSKTAEETAKASKHFHVEKRLQEERINACGQCIFYDKEKAFQLWIGDHSCLEMEWILDLEFDGIMYFHSEPKVPLAYQWLVEQYKYRETIKKLKQNDLPQQSTTPAQSARNTQVANNNNNNKKKPTILNTGRASSPTMTDLVPTDLKKKTAPSNSMVSFSPEIKARKTTNNNNHHFKEIDEDEDLSDIDEPKEKAAPKRQSTRTSKRKTNFLRVTAVAKPSNLLKATEEDDDFDDDDDYDEEDEDDEIQFHPFHIPIDDVDGDNHDNWEELQKFIIPMMDIIPFFHLHQHEDLLAKQSVYSSIQDSQDHQNNNDISEMTSAQGGETATKSRKTLLSLLPGGTSIASNWNRQKPMKKFLIVDDHGNSLAPAMASIYLLLKSSMRINEMMETMKLSRPSIQIGSNVRKGLEAVQYKYDDKVLKRLNQRLRTSVVSSVAF